MLLLFPTYQQKVAFERAYIIGPRGFPSAAQARQHSPPQAAVWRATSTQLDHGSRASGFYPWRNHVILMGSRLIAHHNPITCISWRLSFLFPYPRVPGPSSHSLGSRVALSPQGLREQWVLIAAYQELSAWPFLSKQGVDSRAPTPKPLKPFHLHVDKTPLAQQNSVRVFLSSTRAQGRFSHIRNL